MKVDSDSNLLNMNQDIEICLSLQKEKIRDFSSFPPPTIVGIYGGSFDPIHNGHLQIAKFFLRKRYVDVVLFVPNHLSPFKQHTPPASPQDRLAMLLLAIQTEENCFVSTFEMERPPPSYLIYTLKAAQEVLGERIRFIMGMDALLDLPFWHQAQVLASEFSFLVYPRPNYPSPDPDYLKKYFPSEVVAKLMNAIILDAPLFSISSSQLRQKIQQFSEPLSFLPFPVWQYIKQHGLYTNPPGYSTSSI